MSNIALVVGLTSMYRWQTRKRDNIPTI